MAESEAFISQKDEKNSKNIQSQNLKELLEYLKSSVKNILNEVPEEKFISLYKLCYKEFEKKEDVIKPARTGSSSEAGKYHTQFNDILSKNAFDIIEETLSGMNSKFKELEELTSAQSNSNIQWRPPGNAAQHMIPFEVVSEVEKKNELEVKVEQEREALNILKSRLNQKRKKAKELNELLLSLIEEIKSLVTTKINDEQS